MLTHEEKQACREARFTRPWSTASHGTPEDGLDPIGAVSMMRGAVPRYHLSEGKYWRHFWEPHFNAEGKTVFVGGEDLGIVIDTTEDVVSWSGFSRYKDFAEALEAHGPAIFPPDEVPA